VRTVPTTIAFVLAGGLALSEAAGAVPVEPELVGVVTPEFDPSVPCLTAGEEEAILARLAARKAELAARGVLLSPDAASAPLEFGWPLRLHPVIDDPGYHCVRSYRDHDPTPGFRLDWHCGQRTYDSHHGIDYFIWPFAWLRMEQDQVEVVAAAAGQIIAKVDGNDDHNCVMDGSPWNAVYIQHADGGQAWYGHLKNGSTTTKPEGAMVARGERLGIVGSSGSSTGPHLHFQVFDGNSQLVDPYSGSCNFEPTWWLDQRPYDDSAVNAIRTHDTPAVFPGCPGTEIPNERNAFLPGSTIYFAAYYRDQLSGQVGQYGVYDAAGDPVFQWSHSSPQPYYAAALWYWRIDAPQSGAAFGTWRFEVTFEGVTTTHHFWVGSLVDAPDEFVSITRPRIAVLGANPRSAAAGPVDFIADLPSSGVGRLTVVDVRGRTMASFGDVWRPAGRHVFRWEASGAPAGVYFARWMTPGPSGAEPVTAKAVLTP